MSLALSSPRPDNQRNESNQRNDSIPSQPQKEVTSISVQSSSSLTFPSPPHSPLRPISGNSPLTSTPITNLYSNYSNSKRRLNNSDEVDDRQPSFISPVVSSPVRNNSFLSSKSSMSAVPFHLPDSDDDEEDRLAEMQSNNTNAITRIQVQPSPTPNVHLEETDLDVDGLEVTRIRISGEDHSTGNSQIVNVTVLSESVTTTTTNGHSNGHHEHKATTTVTVNNSQDQEEMEVDEGREPLRLEETMGSQPSDLNDTTSVVSSVINNPSVISQMPDRYGFTGGEQYTHESEPDPSPEIVRRREMKWLQMMDKWDHYMRKEFKTVRSRCRKGIPRSVRGRAWYYLCGAAFIKKKEPNLYQTLLKQDGKPSDIEDIKKDLHRQFPWHEIFAEEGHGKHDLFNVLKAHSILNAKDGYCQAQAPIASILLMHMPAEDAFWCLVAICDKYLKGYYSPDMEQLKLDGDILFGLLKRVCPPVYKHLKKQTIDPVLYMTEWFLCAFTRTLPWTSVLRVWDSFLCEGVKILFRVGLILLKYTLGRTGVLKQCPPMYETLTMLKNFPNYVTNEQFLMVQIQRLDISDDQMRREHYKQVTKRKKALQKLEAAKRKQQQLTTPRQGIYKSHETAL